MSLDLFLDLRRQVASGRGGGRALEIALREAVRSGRLPAGVRLPGTRSLAADLGLARGTVVRVFGQLVAEGWLTASGGSGTRVAHGMHTPGRATEVRPRVVVDLRPGRPDVSSFPRQTWLASLRRVTTTAAAADFDYPDPAGMPALRAALADYLARTRGVHAEPASVVVTAGFRHGLALLARTFRNLGVRTLAMEDPSLPAHRQVVRAAGLLTSPVPVDPDGADPEHLTGAAGAVLLTPSHQYPTGVVLAARRRDAFLAWARRTDGFLVEDDYDGEFQYERRPVGAVQARDPRRVVFAGSTSKSLAPGLRLGWLVVPDELRPVLLEVAGDVGAGPPVVDQLALTDLIARGDYDRHIRQVRHAYARRRVELTARLSPRTLAGASTGLHALVPLGSSAEERRLLAAAARRGLRLHGLHADDYWHGPVDERTAGLLIGFATPPAHGWRGALDEVVRLLAQTERVCPP